MDKENIVKKLLRAAKSITKKLLKPIYHSYIGRKVFSLIEMLTNYKIERNRVHKIIGYYPNLKNPQSYNEKIIWKKIYDRNPLLPIISDKYKVREYIKEILGEKEAQKILIPLLYVTDKPENIPLGTLTEEYAIKPNHASGYIILAENTENKKRFTVLEGCNKSIFFDNNQTKNEIINICKRWLSIPYGFYKHEWAYQEIKRKIIIEKLLRDNKGKIPADYKFIIFNGKCHHIAVWNDRFVDLNKGRYTSDWEYINIHGSARQASYQKKPENLQSMINLAELLGKPFDFIRVDLYLVDTKIFFGEFTSYPASGAVPLKPVSYDFEQGSQWRIVPKYWK